MRLGADYPFWMFTGSEQAPLFMADGDAGDAVQEVAEVATVMGMEGVTAGPRSPRYAQARRR